MDRQTVALTGAPMAYLCPVHARPETTQSRADLGVGRNATPAPTSMATPKRDCARLVAELREFAHVACSMSQAGLLTGNDQAERRASAANLAGLAKGLPQPRVRSFGRHRLVCGRADDANILVALLATETVDLVLGALPCFAQHRDSRAALAAVLRAVEPHAEPSSAAILYAPLRQLVTLVRAGASALVDAAQGRALPQLPAVAMLVHAAPDPMLELIEAVAACSPRGAIVLDPFATTAATVLAAEATGRAARLVCPDDVTADTIMQTWAQTRIVASA